jgi:anti-sigma28 factor (negative regulator of flagellin synthesis)
MKLMQPAPKRIREAEESSSGPRIVRKNAPERLVRLEKIRAAIQSGTYKVDSKRLAEAIVKRHIVD